MRDAIADTQTSSENVPPPLAGQQFSGRFMVRVPPELHRRLALEAAEEKVSLNRHVSRKLATTN